jgi:hypothetical protein
MRVVVLPSRIRASGSLKTPIVSGCCGGSRKRPRPKLDGNRLPSLWTLVPKVAKEIWILRGYGAKSLQKQPYFTVFVGL